MTMKRMEHMAIHLVSGSDELTLLRDGGKLFSHHELELHEVMRV